MGIIGQRYRSVKSLAASSGGESPAWGVGWGLIKKGRGGYGQTTVSTPFRYTAGRYAGPYPLMR